ncbi:MAG: bifunctional methylenetetrahydrofolate dehydrogenase/methenyltetrahydrofolate cyclohydrolase FolD [Pseudomonadales bacterium]|nr:bifunctional methylenetetrahydrofolate dehydrogenase/methenyltetrahydrofolate cyclohydrolase FolD [Pseudomonadales bacterium]
MALILDGKAFAGKLREKVREMTSTLMSEHRIQPGLAVILVGEDPASQVYVRNKGKQALEAGFNSFEHKLPDDISEEKLLSLLDRLNDDDKVHGILVQLPLPPHISEQKVIDRINPEKDVDGFHISNVGKLATGLEGFVPCTPLGCSMLLKDYLGDLSGLNAVVVGRSNIVGKPMAALLLKESCTVTVAHSRTKNLADVCRRADILVAAVGRPKMIKGDWVKPGATVIDVGINRIKKEDGTSALVGDVDFDSVQQVAGAITPVPGGVGPMTIACLLYNTLVAAHRINGIPFPADT